MALRSTARPHGSCWSIVRNGREFSVKLAVFTSKYPARVATFFERDMRSLIEAGGGGGRVPPPPPPPPPRGGAPPPPPPPARARRRRSRPRILLPPRLRGGG